jgi:hypothetical protein
MRKRRIGFSMFASCGGEYVKQLVDKVTTVLQYSMGAQMALSMRHSRDRRQKINLTAFPDR